MKRLLLILILTFSFQILAKADDIRDFQIEGMSIGDSLLDFVSEKEIKINPGENIYRYPNSDKYLLWNSKDAQINLRNYDGMQFHYKLNDSKYIIKTIDAHIFFFENIQDCYPKKKEIYNDIVKLFPNIKVVNENITHNLNKDSKVDQSVWTFDDGYLVLECYDWSVDMPYGDKLSLSMTSNDLDYWLNNEAYK